MKKKKSKLQKKKDNPNSVYWRNKCDTLWSKLVRERDGNVCVICGKENPQAHHIIPKKGNRGVRHELWNGISLCAAHHKWNYQFSAHKCPVPFCSWLFQYRTEQWNMAIAFVNTGDFYGRELGNELSYRDRYNELLIIEVG